MAFGSGLSAQVGFGAESTYGTAVTVDHFYEHDEANLDLEQTWADGMGLHAGGQMQRAGRMVQTTREAAGTFKADVTNKKFGLLVRHMLGSPISVPTLISGTAYKQVHYLGNAAGLSLTTQVGVPSIDGTVNPFSYPGTKVSDWELSCKEGDLLKLALGLTAQDELTLGTTPAGAALAAASYPASPSCFNFAQCVIKLGGTATTTTNVTSIASGVTLATLPRGFSLKGTTPLADKRYGTNATKREPLQNGYTAATLSLDLEMAARTELYDVFRAGTTTAVQITFTGSQIAATGSYDTVDIVLPGCKLRSVKPNGNGQDLTDQPVEILVGDDGSNNLIQIQYISVDATL